MENERLYDISEVCGMLGTTSRTLRFYEEKGIIQSTTEGLSARRRYSEKQLANIRNVLVLRTLGLSVKAIAELQAEKYDLKDAVLSKRAEIFAYINACTSKINLLNEALSALESEKNIFREDWQHSEAPAAEELAIARLCTDAILQGEDEVLYHHFSPRMAEYLPREVYSVLRKDSFAVLGDFISIEKTEADSNYPNIIYSYMRFSKLGLKVKFVFYGGKIEGLWFEYYDVNIRRT